MSLTKDGHKAEPQGAPLISFYCEVHRRHVTIDDCFDCDDHPGCEG